MKEIKFKKKVSLIKNIQAQLCNKSHIAMLIQEWLIAGEIQILKHSHLVHLLVLRGIQAIPMMLL